MATSGSIDFTLTRDTIIADALELIGAIGIGDTPTSADYTTCARTLNMMVKAWQGQGIHLWTETEMTVTLVVDQATYTLSPRPLYIKAARFRNADDVDRPVRVDSRVEFFNIPNKTSAGKINRIYYDPQLGSGTLYVWPVPDDATETLRLTYIRSLEDFDASGDNPDFPQEWLQTITYNLAVRIAAKYGKNVTKTAPELISIAQLSLLEMQLWDTENSKIRIVPAYDPTS